MTSMRVLGIDCIRTFLFLCIYLFHQHDFFYALDPASFFMEPPFLWRLAEGIARVGAFSGFAIFTLTFFLFGRKKSLPSFGFIFGILPCFWLAFCLINALKDFNPPRLIWDIYPLIFVSFLGIAVIEQLSWSILENVLALLSVILLACSPIQLSFLASSFVKEMLVGLCPIDYADWPILPWVGLSYLGYYSGKLSKKYAWRLLRLKPWEYGLGLFILGNLYLHRMAYFATPLNYDWACYNFLRPPSDFWAHLLFWALLVRLSLLAEVQKTLESSAWIRGLSRLCINRSFYLAYFLHYVVLFALLGILRGHGLANDATALNLICLVGPILTEGLSRVAQTIILRVQVISRVWLNSHGLLLGPQHHPQCERHPEDLGYQ